MPSTLSYPGVYIEEIPSGVRTIAGSATSITAFVGRTKWGPVNEPLLLHSYGDFERSFGGLWQDSSLSYALRDFFANGGTQAVVVRLFKSGSTDGTARLTGALAAQATSPGAWGNGLSVAIDHAGSDNPDVYGRYGYGSGELFNITVSSASGASERILNVSMKDGARRVDQVLAQESQYLRLPAAPAVTDRPAATPATGVPLSGGTDSAALDSATYLGSQAAKTGLYALEKAELFNLLCVPPDVRSGDTGLDVYAQAMSYCAQRRAMLIVDPPSAWKGKLASQINPAELNLAGPAARNAMLYYPRVVQADPLRGNRSDEFAPCGIIAGVIARTDAEQGIWKAPAGLSAALSGIQGLSVKLNDAENGALNPLGVNCLRSMPSSGQVIWGARTLRGNDQVGDEYKYIPVRRLALYIEENLYRGTQWAVFEPNDEPLWAQIRLNVGAFMHNLFRQGAFAGQSAKAAYFVKCDAESTTSADVNQGVVNVIVGFAPLRPAEFVVLKLQQMAGQTAS